MKYSLLLWAVWYVSWIVSARKGVREIGQIRAFLGLGFVAIGILIKIRREARALRQHFGLAYEEYARRVPGGLK